MANVFSRFWRFLTGWADDRMSKAEVKRPEIVYDQAIEDQTKKYRQLESAVSGLVMNRNKLRDDLKTARSKHGEVQRMLAHARRDAQSDNKERAEEAIMLGSMLIEDEEKLINRIEQLTENRAVMEERVKDAQAKLVDFQHRIKSLREEKVEAVSQARVDRSTIELSHQLKGINADGEMRSLNNVRENLARLNAQAQMVDEMDSSSLDSRLEKYKKQISAESGRARFLESVEQDKALAAGTSGGNGSASGDAASSAGRQKFLDTVGKDDSLVKPDGD